jgi:hypothetical protein
LENGHPKSTKSKKVSMHCKFAMHWAINLQYINICNKSVLVCILWHRLVATQHRSEEEREKDIVLVRPSRCRRSGPTSMLHCYGSNRHVSSSRPEYGGSHLSCAPRLGHIGSGWRLHPAGERLWRSVEKDTWFTVPGAHHREWAANSDVGVPHGSLEPFSDY